MGVCGQHVCGLFDNAAIVWVGCIDEAKIAFFSIKLQVFTSSMATENSAEIRSVDRELLAAMRVGQCMGVGELTEELGVTATAVRQRIDRLMEKGLIEREKVVSGRGRPTFCYQLTAKGHQRAGADPTDLVDALWREVNALPSEDLRDQILSAVAKRLGKQFAQQAELHNDPPVDSPKGRVEDSSELKRRLYQLSASMANRKIPIEVSSDGEMPVLDINACPFPTLTDRSNDRTMCRLEEQMISEALGQPMKLSSCRLDGDNCCQFSAIAITDQTIHENLSPASTSSAGG